MYPACTYQQLGQFGVSYRLNVHTGNILCLSDESRGSAVRSRYIDSLRAVRPRDRSSSTAGAMSFHFSVSSRSTLRPTPPPIQLVPGSFSPRLKRPEREAVRSTPTNTPGQENLGLYVNFPYVFIG
jgi:hypothetical protein